MQVVEGIPIDIVAVIQGLIVLFIAAPPLIRAIFRLPKPSGIRLLDCICASREGRDDASSGKKDDSRGKKNEVNA